LQVNHQIAVFYFSLPRTGWVGVPKLSFSPGVGNPRYATAWSVVWLFAKCFHVCCCNQADWTDCYQSSPALRLLSYANTNFITQLLVQCSRGAHTTFQACGVLQRK